MLRRSGLNRTPIIAFALATALGACGSPEAARSDDGFDNLGVAQDQLGAPVASCSTAGSSGFGTGQVLTLSLVGGPTSIILSSTGAGINVNGWACVNSSGAALTTSGVVATAVKKIVVNGDPTGNDTVIVDLLSGSFGSTILSGVTGTGIVLAFGSGTNAFMIRGTEGADKLAMGNSAAGDVYADLNGDNKADVKVTGASTYTVTLLSGNDVFTAAGGAITAASLTTGVTSLLPMTQAITLYGGAGDDTLQGGNGNDTLYGGDGNDTFNTSSGASADGNDLYIGGNGTDTVNYGGRTADLTVSIGPAHAVTTGTVDLTTLTYPTELDAETLVIKVDGAAGVTTTFATPANAAAVVSQINTAAAATVASLNALNYLVLTGQVVGVPDSIQVVSGTSLTNLGLMTGTSVASDANDGQSGETDDVTYTVENIIGGSGNDTLTGSDQANAITGGAGNDIINGIANASCSGTGDVLGGGTGNDTFLMGSVPNCGVAVSGGAGTDVVDYSLRTANLNISLDGVANDGDPTANSGAGEKGNINATDVEVVVGGTGDDVIGAGANGTELHGGAGNDTLNGGAGNDTLVGDTGNDIINGGAGNDIILESGTDSYYSPGLACGAGNDIINGGPGFDKVDYSGRTAALTITLCVDPAVAGLPMASPLPTQCSDSDGDPLLTELDNVINVEWLVSGSGADTLTGDSADETIEGGAGNDTIHGGAGNDTIYGGAGNDMLYGEAGDNYLEGGAGDDFMNGGPGDGNICVYDASDVTATPPYVNCSLVEED